jgi:hypothetical protein
MSPENAIMCLVMQPTSLAFKSIQLQTAHVLFASPKMGCIFHKKITNKSMKTAKFKYLETINCMQQRTSWEANSRSATQDISLDL